MEGIWSVKAPTDLQKGWPTTGATLGGAVVFPWTTVTGEVLPQLRLDDPIADENGKKKGYRFPKDSTMVLSVPPGYQDRVMDPAVPLVIVEGTKQHWPQHPHSWSSTPSWWGSADAGAEEGWPAYPCLHGIH